MGILNVTPDSFSDGGRYSDVAAAISHAKEMVEDGADVIDIGGESSRPGASPASKDEELARVLPVVEGLAGEISVPLSIDTCKAEVARRAIEAGAHIVNDITALQGDAEMANVVAGMNTGVILMHMRGSPRTMQHSPVYDDVVSEISSWLLCRIQYAESKGIPPDHIVIDPGIGFGKTVDHNLEILRRLEEFRHLEKPMLIGTSRKSFIGKILNLPVNNRIEGTAATISWAIAHGADMVRVHDVKIMHRVVRMTDVLYR
ncbi:MAG: dihydropteroate synthase [Candidatus Poribacteria bacterium]|nr:dihydropteroate synthase [Candidatus Poribacteria bacterium]MDE0504467.1 dihydropteroate synthase [Candidatus Poribacteria bacterium]